MSESEPDSDMSWDWAMDPIQWAPYAVAVATLAGAAAMWPYLMRQSEKPRVKGDISSGSAQPGTRSSCRFSSKHQRRCDALIMPSLCFSCSGVHEAVIERPRGCERAAKGLILHSGCHT